MPLKLRERTSVVVLAGDGRMSDQGARALIRSLESAGINTLYLGREADAVQIAAAAANADADAVEVCVAGCGAVVLLRQLLHELKRLERREVSIVVHRVQ